MLKYSRFLKFKVFKLWSLWKKIFWWNNYWAKKLLKTYRTLFIPPNNLILHRFCLPLLIQTKYHSTKNQPWLFFHHHLHAITNHSPEKKASGVGGKLEANIAMIRSLVKEALQYSTIYPPTSLAPCHVMSSPKNAPLKRIKGVIREVRCYFWEKDFFCQDEKDRLKKSHY